MPDENQKAAGGTLVAFLSGDAAGVIFEKSDEEIVNMCVDALRKLFPEEVTNVALFLLTYNKYRV